MDIDIFFNPIEKLEVHPDSLGSFIDSHNESFPNWENSEVVFFYG